MNQPTSVLLKRDCAAVQIPAGTTTNLAAGTTVHLTQTLGGTYTVQAPGGLFRIAAQDADALGLAAPNAAAASETAPGEVNEQLVWDTLRTCFDPEIPVNIVDLGLVYDMKLTPQPGRGARVEVKMTLTAPGCGMGPAIAGDAQVKLLNLSGVDDAQVEIVWDPSWHHSMITPAGKKVLGLE
jgi:probable FeS assembly SUF system protein SufT